MSVAPLLDRAAVLALRRRIWANGFRPLEVWGPDQLVDDKGEPLNKPGKQPRGRWIEKAKQDPPGATCEQPDLRALNTGILCGEIVIGIDADITDQELLDKVVEIIEASLGPTPLVRIGQAPKVLLVYRPEEPFRKIKTPELFLPDGQKLQVEVLAEGQQFVGDGIHPITKEPYRWLDESPETVHVSTLPIVCEKTVRNVIKDIEQLLLDAGAKPKRKSNGAAGNETPPGTGFFRNVNNEALANIGSWARSIFPRAKFEPGTGAWRVTSKDLGRDLEEDISIAPSGVRDFGEEIRLTAVDLVMRYVPAGGPTDAALWLCDRLGIDPETLGYTKPPPPDPEPPPTPPNPEPLPLDSLLTLGAWLSRELDPPDFMLGELLSTTTRALLIGPTGLGKTNWLIALGFAAADGTSFLHWQGSGKSRRVLYIDGEMSRRLTKQRLIDAVRRHGGQPADFFYFNREDFPDFEPLNTEKGQHFVDRIIEGCGGIDLIILDNVQALLIGDMKDEEPWQLTLPWVRDLTRRSIGQIWAHHTGHDATHGYGSKTREWQLDLVMLMKEIEHPIADISFSLETTKARERSPDNRQDFEPVCITLERDRWSSSAGVASPSGKPPRPLAVKFHAALLDAISVHGEPHRASAGRFAVTQEQWIVECVRLGLLDNSKPDSQRSLISKNRLDLLAANWIACNGNLVWSIKR